MKVGLDFCRVASSVMGGARPGAKGARAAKLAVKKDIAQKKMEEEVRKDQSLSMKALAENALETLNHRLQQRPLLVQHLKGLLVMGAFDAVDRVTEAEDPDEERLPPSCNKFNLLSRGTVVMLIGHVLPGVLEWLQSLKKVAKAELCDLLGYLCHCHPKSAVPSRRMGDLKTWCRERWEKYGKRLSAASPPQEDASLSEWLEQAGASYWTVDTESADKILYVTGTKVKIPDSLVKMNVKDFVLRDGMRASEAALCHGSLSIKCIDLWMEAENAEFLDTPFFRKEIPVSHKGAQN